MRQVQPKAATATTPGQTRKQRERYVQAGGMLQGYAPDFVIRMGYIAVAAAVVCLVAIVVILAGSLAGPPVGALLVLGVLASFTFQVIYNVTMSAGLAPVKGLTLPLMSYGGSSMIATLAAFGLILNVRMRRFTN